LKSNIGKNVDLNLKKLATDRDFWKTPKAKTGTGGIFRLFTLSMKSNLSSNW
jgi:hypothetical protein